MTPNYVDASPTGIVVSPWCSCRGSGNMEEECEKFLRDFTENPCLRKSPELPQPSQALRVAGAAPLLHGQLISVGLLSVGCLWSGLLRVTRELRGPASLCTGGLEPVAGHADNPRPVPLGTAWGEDLGCLSLLPLRIHF